MKFITTSIPKAALSSLLLLGLTPALAAQWSECHKLLPNDGFAGDGFGAAVATDGTLVAVGSPSADEWGSDSGSAYLFGAHSGAQHFELRASDGAPNDRFGASIAVDGARVVVGAPLADGVGLDSGAVYVFDATTGLEVLKLEPADAAAGIQFGYDVATDGGLIVVGALGAAYLFDLSTGQQLEKLFPTGGSTTLGLSGFGETVDIDAGLVVVGARLENGVSGISGAAYVFDAASGDQLHRLIALNGTAWAFFGASVAIDASVIAIGAPEAGPKGKHSGTAYLFDALTGQQTHNFFPADGHVFAKFGSSVGVDGQDVFVGSDQNNASGLFSAGSVYLYESQGGSQVDKLVASDAAALDEFGGAIAAAGGVMVTGAARDDDLGDASGSAYVFDATGCACSAGMATYCTAKTTSIPGCVPTVGASGTPSVSAGSGFMVTAGPVPGGNPGLFIYSTNPSGTPVANPFGWLCVAPGSGLFRIGFQNGGGTLGTCDGQYAQDFNQYAATQGQDPSLVAGAQVELQAWYRDPPNVGTANLTNAGRFTMCP